MLRLLISSVLLGLCKGQANLDLPAPREKTRWTNQQQYDYSTYTPPTNGIEGCMPASTNSLCQMLENCDGTTQGARTTVTQGGFLTVQWKCDATSRFLEVDDQNENPAAGVTIAVKCGAGSQSSFFSSGSVLSRKFNSGCANTTISGELLSNAVTVGDNFFGDCTVLWVWETRNNVAGNGFFMGCADIRVQREATGGGSSNAATQDDYDNEGATASVVVPLIFLLVGGVVVYCYKDGLPDWLPYVRYGALCFWSLTGFAAGMASNSFTDNDEAKLATDNVRYGAWTLFICLAFGLLMICQKKFELFMDWTLVQFFTTAILIVMLFVGGSLNVLHWEGNDDYCTWSNSDETACNTYKFFIVSLWMVFALMVVEIIIAGLRIFSGEAQEDAEKAQSNPVPRGWKRRRRSSLTGVTRGGVENKKQFYEIKDSEDQELKEMNNP